MAVRTDLICEEKQNFKALDKGCTIEIYKENDIDFEYTEILDDEVARSLKRPKGKYITLKFERLDRITNAENIVEAIISALKKLMGEIPKSVTVVGLGNHDITPDALGPLTANKLLATRHLSKEFKEQTGLSSLISVSAITPGVMGKTGVETKEFVRAAVDFIKPEAVIVIDALAAAETSRLCSTFQLTDTGISPGSGVKNRRKTFNEDSLGVPVIAIGMPTVIDFSGEEDMMVTPKDIDLLISRAAELLSLALNRFLHPSLDPETIAELT